MIFLLAALLLICCYGIKFRQFQPDYMSIPKTTSVKGLFAVLIFLSHAKGYCELQLANDAGVSFLNLLGQMVVVMFLFYSGFGIMRQYENRKESYLNSFLKNRVLKVLIHFDLAVLLYLIIQTLLGNRFSIFAYIFCWTGWSSLGNSNWFIFDILVLYLIAFLSLLANARFSVSKSLSIILLCFLTIVLWLFLHQFRRGETWWYNTIIAFPLGAIYSLLHDVFDAFHKKYPWFFVLLVLFCAAIWYIFRIKIGIDQYGLSALLFSLMVVSGSSVLSIDNDILRWLGKNCFQIYILQRLPMIILSHFGVNTYPYLFFSLSFIITLIISIGFNKVTDIIDVLLFNKNVQQ